MPSHASLFTSRYPSRTGITDNGEQLAPGAVTLAAQLKATGYRTAAFIGGFALDRRFGLNQGFDHYDSPFDLRLNMGGDTGDLKRPAQDVVQSARKWIDENASAPFFVFLHLYDLHTPYDLPPAMRTRFGKASYDSELAYVDETLGNPYNDIGSYLLAKGDSYSSVRWFKRALLAPRYESYAFPHFNLGRVYENRRKLLEAARHYGLALEQKPDFTEAAISLRRMQSRLN